MTSPDEYLDTKALDEIIGDPKRNLTKDLEKRMTENLTIQHHSDPTIGTNQIQLHSKYSGDLNLTIQNPDILRIGTKR